MNISSKLFDRSITVLIAFLIVVSILSGDIGYLLLTIEVIAIIFGFSYLKPNYSLITELVCIFVESLFFPRTRHWLWILFILLNGLVIFELTIVYNRA